MRDASFDHLVGKGEQRWREFEAEQPRVLEINFQFERGRLLNGKIGRLGITHCTPEQFREICSVRHEAASVHIFSKSIAQTGGNREVRNAFSVCRSERVFNRN